MNVNEKKGLFLRWSTFLTVISLIVGTIVWHFNEMKSANTYTDDRVGELKSDMNERFNRIEDSQVRMETKQDKMLFLLKR